MTNSAFLDQYNQLLKQVNGQLLKHFDPQASRVSQAAAYSLQAGGKRLRPLIFLTAYQALTTGTLDEKFPADLLALASSLEYAHTFILIHDDLPGIDNDDLRRGHPTCHRQFDEATAILAGDFLLNRALRLLNEHQQPALATILSRQVEIMIDGEMLDILGENRQLDKTEITLMFQQKTSSMFAAPLLMAATLAQKDTLSLKLEKLAADLGLAFQIQDDVLDIIGNQDALGKPIGSDDQAGKSTWVKLVGLEQAQQDYQDYYQQTRQQLLEVFPDNQARTFLLNLIDYLANRDH